MDALAEQTQKTKVVNEKMKNATLNIAQLEEEKSLGKGCTSEINQRLLRIVKTRDSLFTVSVRQNLSEKTPICIRNAESTAWCFKKWGFFETRGRGGRKIEK